MERDSGGCRVLDCGSRETDGAEHRGHLTAPMILIVSTRTVALQPAPVRSRFSLRIGRSPDIKKNSSPTEALELLNAPHPQ